MLEKQLADIGNEASQDRGAAELLRGWMDNGDVAVDANGVPNIIGNRENSS